ncbi:hypothetical protein JW921_07910, partial [Candidatus Fermentibacterales bacterium]|nr:hypothetical protein [Candidatus Fermentibacterales bacterium]
MSERKGCFSRRACPAPGSSESLLHEGWVIANHILVSFHVAFISSVLALPAVAVLKGEVLRFVFFSAETLVSALFMLVSFHVGIAVHEMGHMLTGARLDALREDVLAEVDRCRSGSLPRRVGFYLRVFLLAPYGKAPGIRKEGLNYYPDAPYNLAVAAAGPRASRNVATLFLPPAVALLAAGLSADAVWAVYAGRLLLGIGVVTLLDFLLADPGKYREFRGQERLAREKAESVAGTTEWSTASVEARGRMLSGRMQT